MHGIVSGGGLQIFLSVLAFGLLRTIMKVFTHGHVRLSGGKRILRYNVAVRALNLLFLAFFCGLDAIDIWLMTFHYKAISAHKAPLVGVVFSLIIFQGFITAIIVVIFGTRIGFDDTGICRKVLTRQRIMLPWSEISSFRREGQIHIFDRLNRRFSVSSYRNGGDDLIAALRSHNIPYRNRNG